MNNIRRRPYFNSVGMRCRNIYPYFKSLLADKDLSRKPFYWLSPAPPSFLCWAKWVSSLCHSSLSTEYPPPPRPSCPTPHPSWSDHYTASKVTLQMGNRIFTGARTAVENKFLKNIYHHWSSSVTKILIGISLKKTFSCWYKTPVLMVVFLTF